MTYILIVVGVEDLLHLQVMMRILSLGSELKSAEFHRTPASLSIHWLYRIPVKKYPDKLLSITDWPKRIVEKLERASDVILSFWSTPPSRLRRAAYRSVRICNRPTKEGCKKIPAVKIGQSSLPALASRRLTYVNRGLGMENPGNVE